LNKNISDNLEQLKEKVKSGNFLDEAKTVRLWGM
jgi:hypothetical protein